MSTHISDDFINYINIHNLDQTERMNRFESKILARLTNPSLITDELILELLSELGFLFLPPIKRWLKLNYLIYFFQS
jgi:hypothetical protein